jgi:hypothetical protein
MHVSKDVNMPTAALGIPEAMVRTRFFLAGEPYTLSAECPKAK